ncbi:MAG: hypothetical protein WCG04_06760, partial [Alphaproteobacteria bacterium]
VRSHGEYVIYQMRCSFYLPFGTTGRTEEVLASNYHKSSCVGRKINPVFDIFRLTPALFQFAALTNCLNITEIIFN